MNTQQSQHATNGATVRAIREGVGISQELLAAKIWYSPADLASIESGERRLTRRLSKQISQAVANHLHTKAA